MQTHVTNAYRVRVERVGSLPDGAMLGPRKRAADVTPLLLQLLPDRKGINGRRRLPDLSML